MNNVGFVAVEDYLRNIATEQELARLKEAIRLREQTLKGRNDQLADPYAVTRELCAPGR